MNILPTSFFSHINVVIIGASGGIGEALVNNLLVQARVNSVWGLSRTHTNQTHSSHPKYQHLAIDYNSEASIKDAAKQIPLPIDIVIMATGLLHNGADIRPEKTYKQLSSQTLQDAMLVNMIGPSLVAKHFIPKMRKDYKAVIAPLSARVGSISDNKLGGWYAYRASKAALNMMIKTFSIELRRTQANTIIVGLHPGTVDTALSKPFQRNVAPKKLFTREFSAQSLLNVVEQLTVDDSGYCFAWDGQKIAE